MSRCKSPSEPLILLPRTTGLREFTPEIARGLGARVWDDDRAIDYMLQWPRDVMRKSLKGNDPAIN